MPDLQAHSPAMGQKDGEKWTAAADLQPTFPKSARLLESKLFIAHDTGFVFKQDWNAVAYRVSQPRATREQLLTVPVVIQWTLGHGADQQFKKSCVHCRMITLRLRLPQRVRSAAC